MNHRKLIFILVALLITTSLACQLGEIQIGSFTGTTVRGSGNVVEETRQITSINSVNLATIGNVIIQIGDQESLRIEAEDNLMKHIESQVRSGTLKLSTTPTSVNLNPTKPVNFFLTVQELDEVRISGSGDIQVPDLESERFRIEIGGSGNISMGNLNADQLEINIGGSGDVLTDKVKVTKFEVDIHGSGDISVDELQSKELTLDVNGSGNLRIDGGQVSTQNINIAGSGDYQAGDLFSEEVGVRIGGSGDITIWAIESLEVRVHGSGNVRYYGRPSVSSTGDGSGDIISLGEK